MDVTKMISDLGFPIASNVILIYAMYKMMTFYADKFSKMAEEIALNTQAVVALREAIDDVKK